MNQKQLAARFGLKLKQYRNGSVTAEPFPVLLKGDEIQAERDEIPAHLQGILDHHNQETSQHERAALDGIENDIPLSTANAAHEGTSWTPEDRGYLAVADFCRMLTTDWRALERCAEAGMVENELVPAFERYREKAKRLFLDYLHRKGRVLSPMVAGPARFPVARNQKRGDSADNAWNAFDAYRKRFLKRLRIDLQPSLKPVRSEDSDAVEALQGKLQAREQEQEEMKRINAAYRKAGRPKAGDDVGCAKLAEILEIEPDGSEIRALRGKLARMESWEKGPFPSWQLSNNNANMRRIRARIAQVKRAQATPSEEKEGADGVRYELDTAGNRVRLYFPGKPEAEIRTRMKRNGFRWSPKLGAWQAYPNTHSVEVAKGLAGLSV